MRVQNAVFTSSSPLAIGTNNLSPSYSFGVSFGARDNEKAANSPLKKTLADAICNELTPLLKATIPSSSELFPKMFHISRGVLSPVIDTLTESIALGLPEASVSKINASAPYFIDASTTQSTQCFNVFAILEQNAYTHDAIPSTIVRIMHYRVTSLSASAASDAPWESQSFDVSVLSYDADTYALYVGS